MTDPADTTQTLYDRHAESWVRDSQVSLSDYTARPRLVELCGELSGKSVLDIGCGEGYVARTLARAGASVTGIDLSPAMVGRALAAESRDRLGIEYRTADVRQTPFGSDWDVVLAVFLFNYLDREATTLVMAKAYRALKPGGAFVFCVPHPAFAFSGHHGSPFDFEAPPNGYFASRDGTFSGRIWRRDGTPLPVQLVHKTWSDYFDALAAAGFNTMPRVVELGVTSDLLALDDAFFGPVARQPLHVAIQVIR